MCTCTYKHPFYVRGTTGHIVLNYGIRLETHCYAFYTVMGAVHLHMHMCNHFRHICLHLLLYRPEIVLMLFVLSGCLYN